MSTATTPTRPADTRWSHRMCRGGPHPGRVAAEVERVRVGLIGAGNVARVGHLPALTAIPEVVLAGVVTEPSAEGEVIARRWGVERAYPDAEALLGDARLDALYVLTPKGLHVPYVE